MNNIIELKNISYSYPNSTNLALKNINLSVQKGIFVAILGHNGAGKTTLNLCLNGLIPQLLEGELTGNIDVAGKDLSQCRIQDMAGIIGLVLDDPEAQVFGRTVLEDTSFGPSNLAWPQTEIYQRVEQAWQMVGLQGYQNRDTSQLSGGEKQRLAIAGIMAMQPEIIAMDEPTCELDPVGSRAIYQTIDKLRAEQQLTLIVTEHDSEQIVNRADQVIVMQQGELAWQGAPQELFRNIPLLNQLGIRPIPVSLVGWDLYEKGLIVYDQIPLDVSSAEKLIRQLLAKNDLPLSINRSVSKPAGPVESNKPALIQVTNLDYHLDDGQIVLQDVNLSINQGEFVAIIGRNGSGKTTLAKHFNGLLKPARGEVLVAGVNTGKTDTATLFQKVGYVFQNPDHQIFSISVEKELAYGLKNAGFDKVEIARRVEQALELTGLNECRCDHPLSLGKGKRQMIALASILVLEPEILVIDEPTTGLDWVGSQKILAIIKKLSEQGTTIILISHDMDIVARYAKRGIVMQDGQILLDANITEIFNQPTILEKAGIIPPQIVRLATRLRDLDFTAEILTEQQFQETFLLPLEDTACL